jgi:hypothetical protein
MIFVVAPPFTVILNCLFLQFYCYETVLLIQTESFLQSSVYHHQMWPSSSPSSSDAKQNSPIECKSSAADMGFTLCRWTPGVLLTETAIHRRRSLSPPSDAATHRMQVPQQTWLTLCWRQECWLETADLTAASSSVVIIGRCCTPPNASLRSRHGLYTLSLTSGVLLTETTISSSSSSSDDAAVPHRMQVPQQTRASNLVAI